MKKKNENLIILISKLFEQNKVIFKQLELLKSASAFTLRDIHKMKYLNQYPKISLKQKSKSSGSKKKFQNSSKVKIKSSKKKLKTKLSIDNTKMSRKLKVKFNSNKSLDYIRIFYLKPLNIIINNI
jgi:N-methylhydantoinase B/oxoprolinase/acetone carboxylase alpha subunit